MVINEGIIDRALRITLGAFLISLTSLGPQTPWGLLGILPLFTGFMGFCPLYRVLGISTAGHLPKGPHAHA